MDGDFDIHVTSSHDHGASWAPSASAIAGIATAFSDRIEPSVSAPFGGRTFDLSSAFWAVSVP